MTVEAVHLIHDDDVEAVAARVGEETVEGWTAGTRFGGVASVHVFVNEGPAAMGNEGAGGSALGIEGVTGDLFFG